MNAIAEPGVTGRRGRQVKGRQTADGDEAVIKHKVLLDRKDELVELMVKANDAAGQLADALKKTAEDSGYNTAMVRKRIAAEVNDRMDSERKKAAQLALVFECDDLEEDARDSED